MMNSEFGIRSSECRPPTPGITWGRGGNSKLKTQNSKLEV
jgi:hypothetical protein